MYKLILTILPLAIVPHIVTMEEEEHLEWQEYLKSLGPSEPVKFEFETAQLGQQQPFETLGQKSIQVLGDQILAGNVSLDQVLKQVPMDLHQIIKDKIFQKLHDVAVMKMDVAALKQLLDRGVNPNVQSKLGKTILINLVDFPIAELNPKKREVIRLLLDKGANPTIPDNTGKNALDYAKENNYPQEIISLLTRYQK